MVVESDAERAQLQVRLLGPFHVSFRGRDVTDGLAGRSRIVFAHLALAGRPVPRDVLVDLCWPDFDPERGRNNLNVAITGIRRAFDWAEIVQHRGGAYRINPSLAADVDVHVVTARLHDAHRLDRDGQRPAAIEAYRAAVDSHGGELLPELPYADWVAPQRSFLRHAHLDAIKRLTQLCLDDGDLFEASWAAQLGLLVDDLDDELVECWLRTLADRRASRQLTAALAGYSARLEDELGVTPSAHLVALATATGDAELPRRARAPAGRADRLAQADGLVRSGSRP